MNAPRWVAYPQADLILASLRRLMNQPPRPRMPNLLIVGEPNNGKTTIVRRFFDAHGVGYVSEDADPVKPLIFAKAPPVADEKSLYISILQCFFTPHRASDPTAKLRYQLVYLLRYCRTRILIIDDFHSLLTGSPLKQREVMGAITLLCNELMIPVVGVGTRDAVRVQHADPQHASDFNVVSLPLWQADQDFQRLLVGFERILPLRRPSRLQQPEIAALLHRISGGNLGDLHRLLIACAREAITSGQEAIDQTIVENFGKT